ncbi:MAG: diaminopimelate epimerase [Parvicellaceae bacterium]|jgi:diaminopimelate epimerase
MIKFEKYQGTGNDFIMIDNREGVVDRNDLDFVIHWCNRKFGIGGDGMILVESHADCDFEMVYFNSDGSQSFCGNGGRCVVSFAKSLGIIKTEAKFMAIDGMHEAKIDEDDKVFLKMGNVNEVEQGENHAFINTGSPHYIQYVNDIEEIDFYGEAEAIRYNERFAEEGTNVNFVGVGDDRLLVRTYERGVEDETLSCGTGVTAVALTASGDENGTYEVLIQTMGGTLEVSFDKVGPMSFENITLIGPGLKVFEGVINE